MGIKEYVSRYKTRILETLDDLYRRISPSYRRAQEQISSLTSQLADQEAQTSQQRTRAGSLEKQLREMRLSLADAQESLGDERDLSYMRKTLAESRDPLTFIPAYQAKKAALDKQKIPYVVLAKGRIIDASPALIKHETPTSAILGQNFLNLSHASDYASGKDRYANNTLALPRHGVYEEIGREELGEVILVRLKYHGQLEDISRKLWHQSRLSVLKAVRAMRDSKKKHKPEPQ